MTAVAHFEAPTRDERRRDWLRDLYYATEPHRQARALHHMEKAREASNDATCDCEPEREGETVLGWRSRSSGEDTSKRIGRALVCKHRSRELWHEYRAKGQRRKFDTVAQCGARIGRVVCRACTTEASVESAKCDQFRLCVSCRGARARKLRERFRRARKAKLQARRRELSQWRGAQWRERFLTLTYPDTGAPSDDVRAVSAAWPDFIRGVRRWLVRRGMPKPLAKEICFLRVLEVTPGATGGHAHLHAWILSPFLPHAVLRVLWARALGESVRERIPVRDVEALHESGKLDARELSEIRSLTRAALVPWPVVDIRATHGDPALELVKYLVKDITRDEVTKEDELVAPEIYASIYCALEGRRSAIASRGLWLPPQACSCKACGVVGELQLVLDRHLFGHDPTAPRAPPADSV